MHDFLYLCIIIVYRLPHIHIMFISYLYSDTIIDICCDGGGEVIDPEEEEATTEEEEIDEEEGGEDTNKHCEY